MLRKSFRHKEIQERKITKEKKKYKKNVKERHSICEKDSGKKRYLLRKEKILQGLVTTNDPSDLETVENSKCDEEPFLPT